MDTSEHLQPSQLVCLDLCHNHHQTRLYSEVIQIVVDRGLCWARPLAMVTTGEETDWLAELATADWLDLRDSADLLLPTTLFRAAYDTEVIPIITQLHRQKPPTDRDRQVHQQVRAFVQALCQVHPSAFSH